MSLLSDLSLYHILTGTSDYRSCEVVNCYRAWSGQPFDVSGTMSHNLIDCIVYGVYRDLDFARWCMNVVTNDRILAAVSAKLIMNNDLSYVHDNVYCIWYPETASEATYRQLATDHPRLIPLVARSCCVAGYIDLLKELDYPPEVHCIADASTPEVKAFMLRTTPHTNVMCDKTLMLGKKGVIVQVTKCMRDVCDTHTIRRTPLSVDDIECKYVCNMSTGTHMNCWPVLSKIRLIADALKLIGGRSQLSSYIESCT